MLVLGLGLGLTKTRGMQPVRASSPPGWAQLALTIPVQGGWGGWREVCMRGFAGLNEWASGVHKYTKCDKSVA